MNVAAICPVCGAEELVEFLELPVVPVLSTMFHHDRASAIDAPRGDLNLAVCRRCALVWNVAFRADLVEYDADYENSQHFSPSFQDFIAELARHLASTYRLSGRDVVEIGSGKGEFLAELCAAADCRGTGFDPTFDGEVDETATGVRIVRRYYDRRTADDIDAALVLARHVLEHLPDPVGFLTDVREASGPETPVYYEVPNAEFLFGDAGMWDLIYQHVAYFSRPTLDAALRRAGYEVTRLRPSFHGQFLSIEATPAPLPAEPEIDAAAVAAVCERIDTFAARLEQRLDRWREQLDVRRQGEVVLWGAGAKGVAFLNLLGSSVEVDRVVDVNPRKRGRFVPGTGQRVDAPSALSGRELDSVLILNSAYENEIREELTRLGSSAPVHMV